MDISVVMILILLIPLVKKHNLNNQDCKLYTHDFNKKKGHSAE